MDSLLLLFLLLIFSVFYPSVHDWGLGLCETVAVPFECLTNIRSCHLLSCLGEFTTLYSHIFTFYTEYLILYSKCFISLLLKIFVSLTNMISMASSCLDMFHDYNQKVSRAMIHYDNTKCTQGKEAAECVLCCILHIVLY